MSGSPVIFQLRGVVTEMQDKSTHKYEMLILTLDNHFEAVCFGRVAKALLSQDLTGKWVEIALEAVRGEKYTNYNLLHVCELPQLG